MSKIIKNNIVYIDNKIIYIYKVSPFNVMTAGKVELKAYSRKFKDMISSVNMPGGILVLPTLYDVNDYSKWYTEQQNNYGSKLYDQPGNENIKEEAKRVAKLELESIEKTITNDYYIYFIENRGKMVNEKYSVLKVLTSSLKVKYEPSVEKILKDAEGVNNEIYKTLRLRYSATSKLKSNEVEKILKNMSLPTINNAKVRDARIEEKSDITIDRFFNMDTGVTNTLFTKIVTISNYEKLSNNPDDNLATLFNGTTPYGMHVKFDLKHHENFIREVETKKKMIRKDQRKFNNMNDYDDNETSKSLQQTTFLHQAAESKETNSTIRFQIYIRISSYNDVLLNETIDSLCRYFNKNKINYDTLTNRQLSARDDFKMWKRNIHTNIMKTDLDFFSNLNFLGGNRAGSNLGQLFLKDFYSGKSIPFDIRSIREGLTSNESTTGLVIGGTGSGKTFMASMIAKSSMMQAGLKVLFLFPKPDKLKLGENDLWFKDHVDVFRIGDVNDTSSKYDGIFDPFFMYKHNLMFAIDEAKNFIKIIMDFYDIVYDELLIDEAVDLLIKRKVNLSMLSLAVQLSEFPSKAGEEKRVERAHMVGNNLLSQAKKQSGKLFFAKKDTKSLDINKAYTVIQLCNIPLTKSKRDTMNDIYAELQFKAVQTVMQSYMSFGDYLAVLDEYGILRQFPSGQEMPDILARTQRSLDNYILIISQNPSDIPTELINQVGYFFIGKTNTISELEEARINFKLSEKMYRFLKDRLEDDTIGELGDRKQYPFVFVDYNNNKSIVTAKVYDTNTFKDFMDIKHLKQQGGVVSESS